MGASEKTKILLAYRSGDICALPDCERAGARLSLDSGFGDPINVGQAAHIEGEKPGANGKPSSARYNLNMSDEERNSFHNLIYLCGTCHKKIDTIPQGENEYPVGRLKTIKKEHENKVRQAMLNAFAEVGFPELEEATNWAMKIQTTINPADYSLLEIDGKIKKNQLHDDSRAVIAMGLGVAGEVSNYIKNVAKLDDAFPEKLKAGFLSEYWRLKNQGANGDELFELMCQFSQQGFQRQAQRSAGLAVLIYLFEACEVFEK